MTFPLIFHLFSAYHLSFLSCLIHFLMFSFPVRYDSIVFFVFWSVTSRGHSSNSLHSNAVGMQLEYSTYSLDYRIVSLLERNISPLSHHHHFLPTAIFTFINPRSEELASDPSILLFLIITSYPDESAPNEVLGSSVNWFSSLSLSLDRDFENVCPDYRTRFWLHLIEPDLLSICGEIQLDWPSAVTIGFFIRRRNEWMTSDSPFFELVSDSISIDGRDCHPETAIQIMLSSLRTVWNWYYCYYDCILLFQTLKLYSFS